MNRQGLARPLSMVVFEMNNEKQSLRKWTLSGVLVLSSVAVLRVFTVYTYAHIKVRPLMGRGPSIHKFLEPYMSAIFQLGYGWHDWTAVNRYVLVVGRIRQEAGSSWYGQAETYAA